MIKFSCMAFIACFFLCSNSISQTFEKAYSLANYRVEGWRIIQNADESYLVIGTANTIGSSSSCGCVLKTDKDGIFIWGKIYSDPNYSNVEFKDINSVGNSYLITGSIHQAFTNRNSIAIKIDSLGNIVYGNSYGQGTVHKSLLLSDGNYLFVGETRGLGAGSYDTYLVKTDTNGTQLWAKTIGTNGYDLIFKALYYGPIHMLWI
jgi:hypothetical protein